MADISKTKMYNRKKLKRGSITDLVFIIVGIFAIALIALMITAVINKLDDRVQDTDLFTSSAKSASQRMRSGFPVVMDSAIFFIFISLVIISLVLASLIVVHPAFFIFYLLEYLLLIYLSAGIANAYQTVSEVSFLSTEAAQYTITIHFFRYFPYIIGAVGVILAIVMYRAKEKLWGAR